MQHRATTASLQIISNNSIDKPLPLPTPSPLSPVLQLGHTQTVLQVEEACDSRLAALIKFDKSSRKTTETSPHPPTTLPQPSTWLHRWGLNNVQKCISATTAVYILNLVESCQLYILIRTNGQPEKNEDCPKHFHKYSPKCYDKGLFSNRRDNLPFYILDTNMHMPLLPTQTVYDFNSVPGNSWLTFLVTGNWIGNITNPRML